MKRLVLGPRSDVVKAFVLSPFPAIATVWLCGVIGSVVARDFRIGLALLLIPWMLLFGMVLSVILELIVVVPLVAGFRRYRWRWVNRGSVALIGFLTGALPVAGIVALSPTGGGALPALNDLQLVVVFGLAGVAGAQTFAWIATKPADGARTG